MRVTPSLLVVVVCVALCLCTAVEVHGEGSVRGHGRLFSTLPDIILKEDLAEASVLPLPVNASNTACTFNGHKGTCMSVSKCGGTSVAGHCPGGTDNQCCIPQAAHKPGCGSAAVKRAAQWADMQLKYCQAPNGARDYDTACSTYCHRSHNKEWDKYRSDCSGLVSFAYGLPAPGRVTSQFAPFTGDISFTIHPKDLKPGDAINAVPSEHIMIFVKWLDANKTKAQFIEEPGCSHNPPYATYTNTEVAFKGEYMKLRCNGMQFRAIRFNSNKKVC